jgi:hypothetical protein
MKPLNYVTESQIDACELMLSVWCVVWQCGSNAEWLAAPMSKQQQQQQHLLSKCSAMK